MIRDAVESGEAQPCQPELMAFLMFKTIAALVVDWEQQHEPLADREIELLFRQMFADTLDRRRTGLSGV